MFKEQIESLFLQMLEIESEITQREDSIREDKKKLSLIKAAHKRLISLEESLHEQSSISS